MPDRSAREIEQELSERLAGILGCPMEHLDPTAPFERLGLESVEATSLLEELGHWLDRELEAPLIWDNPTIERLAQALSSPVPAPETGFTAPATARASEPLALVGVGCRLPGANSLEELRQVLLGGQDLTSIVPSDRWNAEEYYASKPAPGRIATKRGAFIDNVDLFDAEFFAIAPREAQRMDPQQRIALEVAWEALEDAGIPPNSLAGSRTGVFVGISSSDYAHLGLKAHGAITPDAYAATGNSHSIVSNRLSYLLDLRGASISLDTACSSSLVALHLARRALIAGEIDLAVIGAVNLMLTPEPSIAFSDARMLAADGRCKTFDEAADGYGRGEGCVFLIVKRLADADRDADRAISLVHGTAVNQDGFTNGLTAPSGSAQQEVIRAALADAGVEPRQVGYVEAHGTGTPLGDPIEMRALTAVYGHGRAKEGPCAVGSVKANIGHLEAAAGVVGLLKASLSACYGELYPQPNLRQLNRNVKIAPDSICIPTEAQSWKTPGRLAAVSSFGFGGTNAHVIVGAPPDGANARMSDGRQVFMLSAKRPEALTELAHTSVTRLAGAEAVEFARACAASATGRQHMEYRLAVVASDSEQLVSHLHSHLTGGPSRTCTGVATGRSEIGFLFSGQGSQYPGMGEGLYANQPVFRASIDYANEILQPILGYPLTQLLDGACGEDVLCGTHIAQPLLAAMQIALLELWASWGVRPSFVLGHSVGEYVAAVAAGVLTVEDALRAVAERGRLMQELPAPGTMFAGFGDLSAAREVIGRSDHEVSLAAINGPDAFTVSGSAAALEDTTAQLRAHGIVVRPMRVSGAFHSHLMEPVIEPFRRVVETVAHRDRRLPFVSTLTGALLAEEEHLDADYWLRQIRSPVLYGDAVAALYGLGCRTFLEIGPHTTLSTLGRNALPDPQAAWLASTNRQAEAGETVWESLARLHVRGARIDWAAVYGRGRKWSALLPTYAFQRRRHWLEGAVAGHQPLAPRGQDGDNGGTDQRPNVEEPQTPSASLFDRDELLASAQEQRGELLTAQLIDMVSALLGWPASELTPDTRVERLGIDSLRLLEARDVIAEQLAIDISFESLLGAETLGDLADLLVRELELSSHSRSAVR
jgi:acyl transferase domain-containing protein